MKTALLFLLTLTMFSNCDPNRRYREERKNYAREFVGKVWVVKEVLMTGKYANRRMITVDSGGVRHQFEACTDEQYLLVEGDRFTAEVSDVDDLRDSACYLLINRQ